MKVIDCLSTQAFFYCDGIPTKGLWIDLMDIDGWEDVESKLSALYPDMVSDDILCADIEGIGKLFYSSVCDGFSMQAWLDFREELQNTHLDEDVIISFCECFGPSEINISDIEDSYYGQYDSWEDFVYAFVDDTGLLGDMPDNLSAYFDYEKYGRDLSYDFYISDSGHIFRNC